MKNFIDKNNILSKYKNFDEVIIEIGSGDKKKFENSISIDIRDFDNVDLVGDIYEIICYFESESVDLIYSSHCFEHLNDISKLLQEISRTLKKDGILEVAVPHFSNPFYYSDPTHKTYFGLYTFSYFCHDNYFKRKVPHYQDLISMEIIEARLIFRSFRPRYITHIFKKFFEILFNLSVFFKEFYEENITNVVSCYEIKFKIKKIND